MFCSTQVSQRRCVPNLNHAETSSSVLDPDCNCKNSSFTCGKKKKFSHLSAIHFSGAMTFRANFSLLF